MTNKESWEVLKVDEDYEINSIILQIRRVLNGRIYKESVEGGGYLRVYLKKKVILQNTK